MIVRITKSQHVEITTLTEADKNAWLVIGHDPEALVLSVEESRKVAREAAAASELPAYVEKASNVELVVEEIGDGFGSITEEEHAFHRGENSPSTAEHPCKLVWIIASALVEANPNIRRKEVLAACVERGVAYYTARTQYQQYRQVRKEEEAAAARRELEATK